ncbi:MAG: peptide-methionine (R)-S-oxide reductase MsrB [Deltaproteobacteria bacterium]|nr:peptide-methionine (R)-S-oxide reductase MsrB [Deltaproteobacteria bacterium]MBI2992439.1 peptide-methionine (R)-S-oxide reductase MsrB [Deltaproteobacteria bacterium]
MKRRRFIMLLVLAAAGRLRSAWSADAAGEKSLEKIRKNWKSLLARGAKVNLSTEPLRQSQAEWKKILSEPQFYVLREEGTERPFSSPLNDEKRPGVYVCAGCALPLFTSQMKFDSGTGWPSFFTNIPGHLGTKQDYQLILPRTEYHCVRCGGHHGHVFDDGPPPTGQRWCNNGVALKFIPASVKG